MRSKCGINSFGAQIQPVRSPGEIIFENDPHQMVCSGFEAKTGA